MLHRSALEEVGTSARIYTHNDSNSLLSRCSEARNIFPSEHVFRWSVLGPGSCSGAAGKNGMDKTLVPLLSS